MTKLYAKDHEWVAETDEEGVVKIGISEYAQEQLGDVVYVDLPSIGRALSAGEEMATVESVKAASEVFAPVDGEVVSVNEALADDPGLVNSSAEEEGWFLKVRLAEGASLNDLLDAASYDKFCKTLSEPR